MSSQRAWPAGKSEFLSENRISIKGFFSAVHLTPAAYNDHNNGDKFRITLNTGDNGGQALEMGGREINFISFVVVGGQELREIVGMLSDAYDKLVDGQGGSIEDRTGFDED